jgi:hypothetical protein
MLGRTGLSILLSFCLARAPVAQEIVEPPDVRIGDQWFTTWIDYWTNRPSYTATREVVNVTGTAIQVIVKPATGGEFDEIYTSQWNQVTSPISVFEPHSGLLQFPLYVGKAYSVDYVVTFGKNRELRSRHQRTAKVLGWEEVAVPAGKFRALKVEIEGTWASLESASRHGFAKDTIWWVPAIKRWAKRTYEDRSYSGQVGSRTGEELMDYSVK